MSEAQKPIAYLKFWAYQQVTQDGNVNADEGLEVCREGEIGVDGVEAIPVYDTPQEAKINADLLEALEILLDEADSFSVDGVYFNEKCMGHKGIDLARAAIAKAQPAAKGV
jgi:hypothetical protein